MEGKGITFSFSKKVEKKNLQPSALRGSVLAKDVNTTEVIESIEENVIKSNGPQQEELVIPLVEEDRASAIEALRKRASQKKQSNTPAAKEEAPVNHDRELTLEEQAEQALLQEARDYEAVAVQGDPGTIEGAGATGEKAAQVSTLDDYDEVGIECFGMAMLRGMGWNNDGVGRPKVRKLVSIVSAVNKTLSAVATRAPATSDAVKGDEEAALPLVKGAFVNIHQGRHKGTYGMVEEVEVEFLLVRRALARSVGGEAVLREVPANVTVVTAAHYKQNSRIINKEMFDEAKSKENSKKKKRKKQNSSESSDEETKDQNKLEEALCLMKTESSTDRPASNSTSASEQRVKKEPVEIENIAKVEPIDDNDNSDNNRKITNDPSKQILSENSNNVKQDEGIIVPKGSSVDQTDSCLFGRKETVRSARKQRNEDAVKNNDRDKKYSNQHSDDQFPDKRRQSPDRRRQSPDRRRQSPDRRRQSQDRRRESPDRRRESPDRRRESPDRRRKSPDRRRKSPDRRRQSPDRCRQSPDRHRQSPDRRRESPDRRRESPDRRRESPDRQSPDRRRQSPDRRRQSPDRRRQSPDRRRQSPDRRRPSPDRRIESPDRRGQSPDVRSSKTKGSSQSKRMRYMEEDHDRNNSPIDSEEDRHRHKKSRSSNPESHHRKHNNKGSEVEHKDKKNYLSSKYGDASTNARPGMDGALQHGRGVEAPWVREGLTVRIVSEEYKRGKYFKQKVRVVSVLTAASCECRTEQGKVLRDVPPSCLETVIPKQQPRLVLVLRGQLSGQVAVILEQHKEDQEASVQLLDDRSVIARLAYEDICQFNR